MNREEAEWLVGTDAGRWLAEVAESEAPLHAIATTLRRELTADRARLVMEQAELRQRAAAKFPQAERMFFTPIGLEQSTDAWVAAYKSLRFHPHMGGADLCCGIGGDLLAMASRCSSVTGVDRCPGILRLARANADALGVAGASFEAREAAEASVLEFDAWHVDPDRRPAGRRSTKIELHSPDLATLDQLLLRKPSAAIKLAPASEPPESWLREAELEWISRGGECKQLVAWFGTLANNPGARTATKLSLAGEVIGQVSIQPTALAPVCTAIADSIYEPDAAVFAAGLDGALARRHGLCRVSDSAGYLTGAGGVNDPLLAVFSVEEVLSWRLKAVASWLRSRRIGRLEIKSRGVRVDIPKLRQQLSLRGEEQATLILTRTGRKEIAILAKRI